MKLGQRLDEVALWGLKHFRYQSEAKSIARAGALLKQIHDMTVHTSSL